jgi:sugar/nucleoside kinase (ribokinase family)
VQHRPELIAAGNPILDHFAFPTPGERRRLITQFQLPEEGARHMEARRLEELLAMSQTEPPVPGGGAFNAVRIYARLGGSAHYYGAVGAGDRDFGRELRRCGAGSGLRALPGRPSGRSLTLLTPGYPRIIAVAPGAAAELPPFPPQAFAAYSTPEEEGPASRRLLYLEGFLLPQQRLIRSLLRAAERAGLSLVFDPGAAALALQYRGFITEELLPRCSYLFATREELGALDLSAQELRRHFPLLTTVEKRGRQGCVLHTPEWRLSLPAVPADVVEESGSGDLFAGAFLAARRRGAAPEEAAHSALLAGSLAVRVYGGRLAEGAIAELKSRIP